MQRTWDLRRDNPTKGRGKGKGKGKEDEDKEDEDKDGEDEEKGKVKEEISEDKEDKVVNSRGGSSKYRLLKDKDFKGKGKEEEAKDEL